MKHPRQAAVLLSALILALALAACGGGGDSEGSDTLSGPLEPVAGVPLAYQDVAGEAGIERGDGGTTLSLRASGLEPKIAYVAHLHTQGCDQSEPGGPHFQFEPGGGAEPPNEIHLEFTTSAAGAGRATARSEREVPSGEAGSVVLHEAGEAHEHETAGAAGAAEALFVHEGHEHEEGGAPEGGGGQEEGAEPEDGGGQDGGDGAGEPSAPLAIACAELEGGGDAVAATPTIVVRDGEPVGGVQELEFDAGERIRFDVRSDVAEEVHVHGYDLAQNVPAGGAVSFDFPADIEGIFEVELEGRAVQIAELRVDP